MRRASPITVAVWGFGSIGRRHAKNAAALGAKVTVITRSPRRAATDCQELGVEVSSDADAVLSSVDAVIVATPTDEHIEVALRVARAGKALFIEKPLSHTRVGVAQLAHIASGLVVEVGCQLRAHPGLQVLKKRLQGGADGRVLTFHGVVGQRLDMWRPGTDYRRSYSASAARGGGALFDLVHEVDLAHWLCGPVTGLCARLSKVSRLQMEAEDLANLLLECERKACGSLQLDMLSPVYRRTFEIVCEKAIYAWNYSTGTLNRSAARGSRTLYSQAPGFERNDLFMTHMAHFLRRVRNPSVGPLCSMEDGIACLDVLLAARKSSESGKWLAVSWGVRP